MNKTSIKSFWNNGFHKDCDKDKLIQVAKDDINQLLKENEFMFNEIKRYLKIDLGYSDDKAEQELKNAINNHLKGV